MLRKNETGRKPYNKYRKKTLKKNKTKRKPYG
jgi:hypothetical protein